MAKNLQNSHFLLVFVINDPLKKKQRIKIPLNQFTINQHLNIP